jgi:hypothetical protein
MIAHLSGEVPVIEALPDIARESIEAATVHALHANAPRGHNDGRRGRG